MEVKRIANGLVTINRSDFGHDSEGTSYFDYLLAQLKIDNPGDVESLEITDAVVKIYRV